MAQRERLRPGVRVEVEGDRVRFASLERELMLRGPASVRLWNSLKDSLEAGIDSAELAAITDARARDVVVAFIESLRREQFLQEAEAGDGVDDSCFSEELRRYVSFTARRPVAMLRHLERLRVRFTGTPALEAAVRDLFSSHGILAAEMSEAAEGLAERVVGLLEFGDPSTEESWVVTCSRAGEGALVVGPVPAAAGESDVPSCVPDGAVNETSLGDDGIVAQLLAAQLLIACLSTVMGATNPAGPSRAAVVPEYYATDSHLVSERHPFVGKQWFDRLEWDSVSPNDIPASDDHVSVDDWSGRVSSLWDPVFGALANPDPGSLPQSPYGSAQINETSRPRFGVGLTTAEARWDLFVDQLRSAYDIPSTTGIGLSPAHAATDLIQHACQHASSLDVPRELSDIEFSEQTRWAWARASLEFSAQPTVRVWCLGDDESGLRRCEASAEGLVSAWVGSTGDGAVLTAIERLNAQLLLRQTIGRREEPQSPFVCATGDTDLVNRACAVLGIEHIDFADATPVGLWLARRGW